MDGNLRDKPSYIPEIIVGAGYLVFILLLTAACLAALAMTYKAGPADKRARATSTPVLTPPAHVQATPAAGQPGTFFENFEENDYTWRVHHWDTEDVDIRGGKLLIENKDEDSYVTVLCSPCLLRIEPYYLQAEFRADAAPTDIFGILLRTRYSAREFYLFSINTETHEYFFDQHINGNWYLRAAGISNLIHSFPAVNTIGIYVGGPKLEFYANGQLMDTYEESGVFFEGGSTGFYQEGTKYRLEIDNLIVEPSGE